MDETKIYITRDGKEIECDLLVTFKNTKNNQDYAIYTENMLDDEGKTMIFATTYKVDSETNKYIGIAEPTTQEEWDEVINVLKQINGMN